MRFIFTNQSQWTQNGLKHAPKHLLEELFLEIEHLTIPFAFYGDTSYSIASRSFVPLTQINASNVFGH